MAQLLLVWVPAWEDLMVLSGLQFHFAHRHHTDVCFLLPLPTTSPAARSAERCALSCPMLLRGRSCYTSSAMRSLPTRRKATWVAALFIKTAWRATAPIILCEFL